MPRPLLNRHLHNPRFTEQGQLRLTLRVEGGEWIWLLPIVTIHDVLNSCCRCVLSAFQAVLFPYSCSGQYFVIRSISKLVTQYPVYIPGHPTHPRTRVLSAP